AAVHRVVGRLIVTPRMHRAHHALDAGTAPGNFGVVLSIWDALFGTRRADADRDAPVGVAGFDDRGRPFTAALLTPFVGTPRSAAPGASLEGDRDARHEERGRGATRSGIDLGRAPGVSDPRHREDAERGEEDGADESSGRGHLSRSIAHESTTSSRMTRPADVGPPRHDD
ncbi:MAG: sterol desaturase family protein, partial [Polyangiales bacterium]